ncbi:hypothetical protein [Jiangella anatolica]|nr:hypothetical protein [Jiangella anatolica]
MPAESPHFLGERDGVIVVNSGIAGAMSVIVIVEILRPNPAG